MKLYHKPIHRWFKIGKGNLSIALLIPPCFAFTFELASDSKGEWELALCIFIFAITYRWGEANDNKHMGY